MLWGLLPAKDKKYLSKSPFRNNNLPDYDRRGFAHIVSYISEGHTPESYFYGADDEIRMEFLTNYDELDKVFGAIFLVKNLRKICSSVHLENRQIY